MITFVMTPSHFPLALRQNFKVILAEHGHRKNHRVSEYQRVQIQMFLFIDY